MLWNQSQKLARHLANLGSGPDIKVGICMDKSKWAFVAMLAILQSGGIVVPLSTQHPLARIEVILQDTNMQTIIADGAQSERLGTLVPNILVPMEPWIENLAIKLDACSSLSGVTPETAAWIIYTSGSTGKPKGVVLNHSSLCTSLQAHGDKFGLGKHTRGLQFSAFSFDISIADSLGVLFSGGCICVPSESERVNSLGKYMNSMQINFAMLTSTVAGVLDPLSIPTLEVLALIGEAPNAAVVDKWLRHVTLINGYGPAECTIGVSTTKILDKSQALNIGRPLAGSFWVAEPDNYHRLCPIGVPGELLIEGPLLSRGYLNDPEKTALAFVTDPEFTNALGLTPGRRMYRTGDLVKYNEDGSLTYIGRRDTQIKIRGQRVETGEIEYWVSRLLPDVQKVAVDVMDQSKTNATDQRNVLVAAIEFNAKSVFRDLQYVGITQGSSDPKLLLVSDTLDDMFNQAKNSLADLLPSYMVPNIFIPLSHLPLNVSGKLDRRAIHNILDSFDPETVQSLVSSTAEAVIIPVTDSERYIQSLWASTLGMETRSIGANSHFFQLGGDSVMAIRVATASNGKVTVAAIFKHPKLSDLAKTIELNEIYAQYDMDIPSFSLWADASSIRIQELADKCSVDQDQIEDVYPCTPLQEGLMAITCQKPTAYISRRVFSLSHSVDIQRFKETWNRVVQLVPILRTRIVPTGDKTALQVVIKDTIQWNSSRSLSSYLEGDELNSMTYGGPLSRWSIVEEPEPAAKRYFVWTSHHSTYDAWSIKNIFKLAVSIYGTEDITYSIPQFSRYVKYVADVDPDAARTYWRTQLEDLSPVTFPSLPWQRFQPNVQETATRNILDSCQAGSQTLSTILRATWAIVISKHLGVDDPLITTTLSGRTSPVAGIDELPGPTISTVPVRVIIDSQATIEEFLTSVQKQAVEMIPYEPVGLQTIRQYVPSAMLDSGHLFVVQTPAEKEDDFNTGMADVQSLDMSLEGFDSYALNLICTTDMEVGNIEMQVRFDDSVISKARVHRLLSQFEAIFHQLRSGTTDLVGDINALGEEDVRQIQSWNKSSSPETQALIHDRIHDICVQQPAATAVDAWDGQFDYETLWDHARRIAHHLVNLGIGPEKNVGLCMDKSKWVPVLMIAILQAGGVVVPLGIQDPLSRLETLIQDTNMSVIIADENQATRLRNVGPRLFIPSDRALESLPTASPGPACAIVAPKNAAWIIYTSGSTGVPKGVVLEHASLLTSLEAQGRKFNSGPHTRYSQFSAHTFDSSIQEIMTTLCHGGCVCIMSESERVNDLAGALNRMRVNMSLLTSTVATTLEPASVPSLKMMVLGGEAMTDAAMKRWCSDITALNAYGPSECSVISSVTSPLTPEGDVSNIGSPLVGRLWVASPSDFNQLCPIGVVGELLVEGPHLARGYLNRSKETETAFIVDPAFAKSFRLSPGCRMYRTGDLVRQNDDGTLSYIARQDAQVKIRGQRVETGEIEHWITRLLPEVRIASVDIIQENGGDGMEGRFTLVAAVEFTVESELSISGHDVHEQTNLIPSSDQLLDTFHRLRTSLMEKLPVYMVPSTYIPMKKLPVNTSGKLDRRALREALKKIDPVVLSGYMCRRSHVNERLSPMEAKLRPLIASLLSLEETHVSKDDNVFHLGGDSITIMRLVTTARSHGIQLQAKDVFDVPTLAGIAAVARETGLPYAEDIEEYRPYSLLGLSDISSYTETRLCPLLRTTPDQIVDVMPVTDFQAHSVSTDFTKIYSESHYFTIRWNDKADLEHLKSSCIELVRQLEVLRTTFVFDNGRLLQVVLKDSKLDIGIRITDQPVEAMENHLIEHDMYRSPELGQPFADIAIMQGNAGPNKTSILFRMSHAIYDGISISSIWSRLAEIYNTGSAVTSSIPFSQFLSKQNQILTENTYNYWRDLLEGASVPQLGFNSSPAQQTPRHVENTSSRKIKVSATTFKNFTPSLYVKAAWAFCLSQYANNTDVVFGDAVSGRELMDGSAAAEAIGCCTAIQPVRVHFQDTWTVNDLLQHLLQQQVQSAQHSSLGHRGIIRDCTNWPTSTRFTSFVNHVPDNVSKITMGNQPATIEHLTSRKGQASIFDLALTSTRGPDYLELTLSSSKTTIGLNMAQHLLNQVANILDVFISGLDARLDQIDQLQVSQMAYKDSIDPPIHHLANGSSSKESEVPKNIILAARAKVFDGCRGEKQSDVAAFFKLGHDLVDGAAIVDHLRREGYELTIEDVINHSAWEELS